MSTHRLRTVLLICLFLFAASACFPRTGGITFEELERTYAVGTIIVRLSQTLTATSPAPGLPTDTETPAFLPRRTATNTPLPRATPLPTGTASPPPCEAAAFVQDVTVPAGANFYPGDRFTKIWRLRNTGSCTWTREYALVFVDGDRMSDASTVQLPGNVLPQQEVDVAVSMSAPTEPGRYRGGWKLRNPSGALINLPGSTPLYVSIEVITPLATRLAYSFTGQPCAATWTSSVSGINPLLCPGNREDNTGYIIGWDKLRVEGNLETDRPALEVHPPWRTHPLWDPKQQGGWTRGVYPAVVVPTGAHFKAQVGCLQDATTCDVVFSLQIRVPGLPWQELGMWGQVYDGRLDTIDIDLAEFVGLNAEFLLEINANNNGGTDQGAWIYPRLEN